MKKSIFLFFAAILCAMNANAYNQSAKDLYFDNSEAKWSSCYVYIGKGDYTSCYPLTRVSGTQYLWQLAKADFNGGGSWNGATGWVLCNEKWWDGNSESIDKYTWHGDKNVTQKTGSAWVDTKIYKTNGTASTTSDSHTIQAYKVTSYTKSNYTVTINTVEGGTLTVKDYDNNAVATGASKIHLTVLKFSAAPASGYVLEGVQINDGSTTTTISASEINTKTHTLTSNVTITPVWKATTSTVTVTTSATNGTVTGGGVVEEGTSVTLTATPADGYKFVNWTVGGAVVSTANPYTFTTEVDVTVVANFEELPKTTVYFVNTPGWTDVKAYAYSPANASWPGVAATKEAEKIGDFDVYSYTATEGKYANVIFNGNGGQTADLTWSEGVDKYYIHGYNGNTGWYTKAEAEAILVVPVEYDYVYLINTNDWAKAYIYTWTPTVAGWPGAAMTKEAEQIAGKDVYSYKVVKGTTFGGLNFNCGGDECKTGDLTWQAGKYYAPSTGEWYADAATAEAALAAVVTYDYYLTGSLVGGWDVKQQGIEKDGELYKATFTELNAGIYEFKITAGDWEHQWNYNNLGAAYEEVSQGVDGEGNPNGNIKIVTEEAKNITVIFDATAGKITFEGLTPYVAPLTYTVTVPAGTEKCYIAGSMNGWAFQEMETVTGETNKFTITIVGAKETDEYKYACQADWAYAEVIDGGGNRTQWTALDNVTAWNKPVIYTYYLMGVNDDWATGIEMEVNTDAENEVMLTCQPVNGEVKIKRLGDDASEYWYGGNSLKAEEGNLGTNTGTGDEDGNILLEEGIYNFYFNTADGKLWIAAATGCVTEPEYNVVEDEITNFVFDTEAWPMVCMGGPSTNYQIEVFLTLTEEADGTLAYEDCSVSIMGTDATFIDGTLSNIDPFAPYADAVLHVQWDGDYYELQLAMSSTPAAAITIEAEDATVTLTEYPTNFEETEFAYELNMVANWVNEAESLPYTVEFIIPTFDPTKASGEYNANFYINGEGDAAGMNENVSVTVTKDGNNVTLTGNVSALNGNAYNVTISGTLPAAAPTEIDVTLSGMVKTPISRMGSYKFLSLDDEAGNQFSIMNGSEEAYGDFEVNGYLIDYDVTVVGNGTWEVVDGVETLTATLQVEDDNTTIYNVVATVGAATTITLECLDATYTITDPEYNEVTFTGVADGKEFTILVSYFGGEYYSEGEWGETLILGTEVEFDDTDAEAYYLGGTYIDDANNTYEVAIFGAPAVVAPETYTRDVTNKYGTICLPYASNSYDGATFYRVAGKEEGKVYLESVNALEAGVPYIFEATASTITVTYQGEAVDAPQNDDANGLVGTFTEITVPDGDYILYNNAFCTNESAGTLNKIKENRAYLDMDAVTGGAPQQLPGRRYISMDAKGENAATGLDNITNGENIVIKTIENGQLTIIRNGEKFNAQGVRF